MPKPTHLRQILAQTSLLPRLPHPVQVLPEVRADVVRLMAELILGAAVRGAGASDETR